MNDYAYCEIIAAIRNEKVPFTATYCLHLPVDVHLSHVIHNTILHTYAHTHAHTHTQARELNFTLYDKKIRPVFSVMYMVSCGTLSSLFYRYDM